MMVLTLLLPLCLIVLVPSVTAFQSPMERSWRTSHHYHYHRPTSSQPPPFPSHPERRFRRGRLQLYPDNNNDDNEAPPSSSAVVSQLIDQAGSLLVTIPTLLALSAFVDYYQWLATSVIFLALRFLAFSIVLFEETLEEDEYGIRPPNNDEQRELQLIRSLTIDAACLILAGLAGYFFDNGPRLLAVSGMAVAVLLFLKQDLADIKEQEQLTKDDKLLNRFDQKLRDDK